MGDDFIKSGYALIMAGVLYGPGDNVNSRTRFDILAEYGEEVPGIKND